MIFWRIDECSLLLWAIYEVLKAIKNCALWLQPRWILSVQIKYYLVNGLSLFVLKNNFRLLRERIETILTTTITTNKHGGGPVIPQPKLLHLWCLARPQFTFNKNVKTEPINILLKSFYTVTQSYFGMKKVESIFCIYKE